MLGGATRPCAPSQGSFLFDFFLHDLRVNHRVELGSVHDEPEHPHEEDGETEEPESEPA